MLSGINIKAIQELQIIMEKHGKEMAESLKIFYNFNDGLSQSLKSLTQFGINVSKAFEDFQKISNGLSKSLKPAYDIMESIQKNAIQLKNINIPSLDLTIRGLKELQEKVINIPENLQPINLRPSLFAAPISHDVRFKKLIKEAILELEEERLRSKKQDMEELSKEKKIKGFAHGKEN